MDLFELFVKIGVKDEASSTIGKISEKLGNGLKTSAKIGTAAVTTAAAGIAALTTTAVNNYAEYEQLAGGAELMFGKAFDTVQKNAQEAYKTVQMSQNEYLQQVNGFATGLKTALGGNEQAAADLSHKIIKAEADIIAATGNSAENVQNAFNGIMKSNFTMLDNLQIGITPTKEGFQEVIDKVNEWNKANGEATNYQMGNLADMQSALVDYIDMVGMSGYAQKEAAGTITGSFATVKSAWSNLLAGIADDNADFDSLITNLVESVGAAANNILPRVQIALNGAVKLVSGIAPSIVKELPKITSEILPSLLEGTLTLANAVVEIIPELLEAILPALAEQSDMIFQSVLDTILLVLENLAESTPILIDSLATIIDSALLWIGEYSEVIAQAGFGILMAIANGIIDNLPQLIDTVLLMISYFVDAFLAPERMDQLISAAGNVIMALVDGIIKALPGLVDAVISIIGKLTEFLTNKQNLTSLLDGAVAIISKLVEAILENLSPLLDAAIEMILALVEFLLDPEVIKEIITAAAEIVAQLALGLVGAVGDLLEAAVELIGEIANLFIEADWGEIGKNIVDGLLEGIKNAWKTLKTWITDAWDSLVGGIKDFLGIESPPKLFAEIGGYTADDDGYTTTVSVNADDGGLYSGGSSVVINQNIYAKAQTPSELYIEAQIAAERSVFMGV